MKSILFLAFCVFSTFAHASNCGPEIVNWPEDLKINCGDQIVSNPPGHSVGSTYKAMDPNNGGDSTFVCTEQGWKIVSGECYVQRDMYCINERLGSTLNLEQISRLLEPGTEGRGAIVAAANACAKF